LFYLERLAPPSVDYCGIIVDFLALN